MTTYLLFLDVGGFCNFKTPEREFDESEVCRYAPGESSDGVWGVPGVCGGKNPFTAALVDAVLEDDSPVLAKSLGGLKQHSMVISKLPHVP